MKLWYVLVLFLVLQVSCREGSESFDMQYQLFYTLNSFGFFDGGTADVNVTLADPNYTAVLFSCPVSDWRAIYAESLSETGLCNTTQPIEDCYQIEFTGSGELSFTVESSKRSTIYYFGMVSCEIYSTEADLDYLFLNPNGQQLSTSYSPLPILYLCCFFLWVPLTVAWVVHWIIYRDLITKLHLLITVYPFSKLFWELTGSIFWYIASHNAYLEKEGVALFGVSRLLCQCLLISVFLLVSRGWGITNDRRAKYDVILTIATLSAFAICLLGNYFSGLLQFSVIIGYIFVVVAIFTFTSHTMQRLEAMRHTPNVDEIGIHLHRPEEIDRKKNLMRLFHALMICFCGIQVMITALGALVFYQVWITTTLFEFVDYATFISLCVIFRLTRKGSHFFLVGVAGAGEKEKLINRDVSWADIETDREAQSNNPYNVENFGPGQGGAE